MKEKGVKLHMLFGNQNKIFVYRGDGDRRRRDFQFITMRRRKNSCKNSIYTYLFSLIDEMVVFYKIRTCIHTNMHTYIDNQPFFYKYTQRYICR